MMAFDRLKDRIFSQLDRIEFYTMIAAKNVLNIDDVAFLTGFSRSHIYKLTSEKKIPHYKHNGKQIYFDRKEVEDWLKEVKIGDFSLSNPENKDLALRGNEAQQIVLSEIKALASILKAEQSALVDQEVEILMNKLRLTT